MQPPKRHRPKSRLNETLTRTWIKSSPGLVLLDSTLRPLAFNADAASILAYPERTGLESSTKLRIPEEILEDIRMRRPLLGGAVVSHFRAGKRRYISHAFAMKSFEEYTSQPTIALLLQRDSSATEAIHEVAVEFGLSEREEEVLKDISLGLNSSELAEAMDISPNTVKAYLRLIMVKMGVSTRAQMLVKILEHNRFTA
jgi:DNA-binding NarL/FixJ family response regulator